MANYEGKKPLSMTCPKCGKNGSHEVTKTYPKQYRWDDSATKLFADFDMKDIRYRRREKICQHCGKSFDTVEFSFEFLGQMIDKLKGLHKENDELRSARDRFSVKALKAFDRLQEIREMTVVDGEEDYQEYRKDEMRYSRIEEVLRIGEKNGIITDRDIKKHFPETKTNADELNSMVLLLRRRGAKVEG